MIRAKAAMIAVVIGAAGAAPCGAQEPRAVPELLPSAGGSLDGEADGGAGLPGHGWFVVVGATGRPDLVHVPPRKRAGADGLVHGSADGVVRKVISLDEPARVLGAWGDRCYVVFDSVAVPGEPAGRAVGSVAARPTAMRDRWGFDPPDRLAPEPPLIGGGELEAFGAGEFGAVAMIVDGAPGHTARRRLFVLDGREWRDGNLPAELGLADPQSPVLLVGGGRGVEIVRRRRDGSGDSWFGTAHRPPARSVFDDDQEEASDSGAAGEAPAARPFEFTWERRALGADGSVPMFTAGNSRLFRSGGRVYLAEPAPGAVRVFELSERTCLRVAEVGGVGGTVAVIGVDTPPRAIVAWAVHNRPAGVSRVDAAHLEVREVSLVDGRVEYSGEGVEVPPLSPREVQWLAIGLVVLMGAVLVVVLTSDPGADTYSIPEGTSLAPVSRRVGAGAADLITAGLVAARLMGLGLQDLADPEFLLSSRSLVFVGLVVVSGLVLGVVGEAAFGRSIGKLMAGCVVVDVRSSEGMARPRWWQALVRNLIKWVLSPAAILGLMDTTGRHRGDSLARTAVVMIDEDEPDAEDPDD